MKSDTSANGLVGYRPILNQKHHHSFPEWCGKEGKNAKKSIYLIQVLCNSSSIDLIVHLKVPFQSEALTQDNNEKRHHLFSGGYGNYCNGTSGKSRGGTSES